MVILNYEICKNKSIKLIKQKNMKSVIIWFTYYMYLDENASKNFLISNLLLRGSNNYKTSRDISKFLYEHYGATIGVDVNLKGEIYILSIYVNFVNDKLLPSDKNLAKGIINFMKDIIYNPYIKNELFNDSYFQMEKKNLINAIKSRKRNKISYAIDKCIEIMCSGEAYEIDKLGKETWAKNITNSQLVERHREIVEYMPLNIYIFGDVDNTKYIDEIINVFDFNDGISIEPVKSNYVRKELPLEHYEKVQTAQGRLCMGFRTQTNLNSYFYPALVVTNRMFGGGPQSRLFNEIREKYSLCYSISSSIEKYKGLLFVDCGIDSKNYEVVKNSIINILDSIKSGNFNEDDINDAVTGAKYTLVNMQDNYMDLLSYLEGLYIYNAKYTIDDFINKIDMVKKKDIIDCANNIHLDTVYFVGNR